VLSFVKVLGAFFNATFVLSALSLIELLGRVIVAPLSTVRLFCTSRFWVTTISEVVVVKPDNEIVPRTLIYSSNIFKNIGALPHESPVCGGLEAADVSTASEIALIIRRDKVNTNNESRIQNYLVISDISKGKKD